jgi:TrwC relaxase
VAVRVSAESGFDPGYVLKGQAEQAAGERTAGGYYINAAQAGEAPGRWFGKGAEALGFASGQVVDAAPFLAVYAQVELCQRFWTVSRVVDHAAVAAAW